MSRRIVRSRRLISKKKKERIFRSLWSDYPCCVRSCFERTPQNEERLFIKLV